MSNIHGLHSLKGNKPESGHSSDSEGDDNDRQGFFVGGSDRSGQEVLGPPSNPNQGDVASRLFEAARSAGAEQISPEELESATPRSSAGSSFQGGVYRLGGYGQESQAISSAREQQQGNSLNKTAVVVNFNVWQNGFSLDDGPLRDFANPENRIFLEAISRGQIPQELLQRYHGRKIDFHMVRKNSPYVAPKMKPFAGEGHRLGSVVPNVVSSEVVELDKPTEDELKELLKKAQESVGLRSADPTTRVQIRLPSVQQPLVGTFNQDHTVMDLRNFIVNAQPNLAFQPFQLMAAYPTKTIENEAETLKDAGILNAVVNVKYI